MVATKKNITVSVIVCLAEANVFGGGSSIEEAYKNLVSNVDEAGMCIEDYDTKRIVAYEVGRTGRMLLNPRVEWDQQ